MRGINSQEQTMTAKKTGVTGDVVYPRSFSRIASFRTSSDGLDRTVSLSFPQEAAIWPDISKANHTAELFARKLAGVTVTVGVTRIILILDSNRKPNDRKWRLSIDVNCMWTWIVIRGRHSRFIAATGLSTFLLMIMKCNYHVSTEFSLDNWESIRVINLLFVLVCVNIY